MTAGEWLVGLWTRLEALWITLREDVGAGGVDVSMINQGLWCGAALTTAADIAQIAADGITADIDCRLEFNDSSLIAGYNDLPPTPGALKHHPQIAYCYDGVADDGRPKPVSWFATAWEFAQPILAADGVVLAHCDAGVNRGPSMAYFLLRAHWGMTGDDAFALIRSRRPRAEVIYRPDADRAIVALGLA